MAGEVRVRRERGGRHHRWCAVLSRVSRLLTRVNYDRVSFDLTPCSGRTEIQHREWWQKDLIWNTYCSEVIPPSYLAIDLLEKLRPGISRAPKGTPYGRLHG